MPGPRTRPSDAGRIAARDAAQRLGRDARTARLSVGWTQRTVARRAGVSQSSVSRLEAGDPRLALRLVYQVLVSLGLRGSLKAYPGAGIGLRDSGQLALAEVVRARAHGSWRITFEAPTTADGSQAADLLLLGRGGGLHIELESRLVDFQAQLRAGHLKRDALQDRLGTPIRFVLALRDTPANRAAVRAHRGVVESALPIRAAAVWRAIGSGVLPGGDGLLWLRAPRRGG